MVRVTLMDELVSEVTANIRVVEHRVPSLVSPTELAELKLVLKSRLPQVEVIRQSITVPSDTLQ